MKFTVSSKNEMIEAGEKLGKSLKAGDIVLLRGDLGAGKTTFTKGIARALGILDTVNSPTFVLMNAYEGTLGRLYHFDMYRINGVECRSCGLDEYIFAPDAVKVIEWAENIEDVLVGKTLNVVIKVVGENQREVEVD